LEEKRLKNNTQFVIGCSAKNNTQFVFGCSVKNNTQFVIGCSAEQKLHIDEYFFLSSSNLSIVYPAGLIGS
jgi:cytidine deaminase